MRKGKRRKGQKAFTLVEVLVAGAILAFGVVAIYDALFTSLDAFSYYSNYLEVQNWMEEKIWRAQEDLLRRGDLRAEQTDGTFRQGGRKFVWNMTVEPLHEDLFVLDLELSWDQGRRTIRVQRAAYALASYEQPAVP